MTNLATAPWTSAISASPVQWTDSRQTGTAHHYAAQAPPRGTDGETASLPSSPIGYERKRLNSPNDRVTSQTARCISPIPPFGLPSPSTIREKSYLQRSLPRLTRRHERTTSDQGTQRARTACTLPTKNTSTSITDEKKKVIMRYGSKCRWDAVQWKDILRHDSGRGRGRARWG